MLLGAGETRQEFARRLRVLRPDIKVECFLDSCREGQWESIAIHRPSNLHNLSPSFRLIIASVFWSEIGAEVESSYARDYWVLSNNIINSASHLSLYGPFYFAEKELLKLAKRFEAVEVRFDKEGDRTVLRSDEIRAGAESHTAVTIDSFVEQENITLDLVKLDIEGAGMNALKGAQRSILKWRPKMAVSLYQRKEDLFEIPEYLLLLLPDYKFSISASNPTSVDMVLYAY